MSDEQAESEIASKPSREFPIVAPYPVTATMMKAALREMPDADQGRLGYAIKAALDAMRLTITVGSGGGGSKSKIAGTTTFMHDAETFSGGVCGDNTAAAPGTIRQTTIIHGTGGGGASIRSVAQAGKPGPYQEQS